MGKFIAHFFGLLLLITAAVYSEGTLQVIFAIAVLVFVPPTFLAFRAAVMGAK